MLLIDASMLMYRCYSKMDFLKTSTGVKTGLEFGTLRSLESLQKNYPDSQIVVCFDRKSWRKDVSKEYKANRAPWPDDLKNRFGVFKDVLRALYATSEQDGLEADDVMFKLSKSQPGPHQIYTNDHDLLQAVDDVRGVTVLKSWKSKIYTYDMAKVMEKFGVTPENLAFLRAFIGDKSDNLKGIPRINKDHLAKLIMWGRAKGLGDKKLLEEILSADWSKSVKRELNSFVNPELLIGTGWGDNYVLMKLIGDAVGDEPVTITPAIENKELIVKRMLQWEIKSLKLCEKYDVKFETSKEF